MSTLCRVRRNHLNAIDAVTITVKHLLLECRKYVTICNKYFCNPTLSDMLAEMLFSFKNKYHYTYPNTYIALYFSCAKVTCSTHKNKKLLSIPLKLNYHSLTFPLPLGGAPPHTQTSHSRQYTYIVGQEGGKHICFRVSIMSIAGCLRSRLS